MKGENWGGLVLCRLDMSLYLLISVNIIDISRLITYTCLPPFIDHHYGFVCSLLMLFNSSGLGCDNFRGGRKIKSSIGHVLGMSK